MEIGTELAFKNSEEADGIDGLGSVKVVIVMRLIPWKNRHIAHPLTSMQHDMSRLFDRFLGHD
jgi:hypothetical protein